MFARGSVGYNRPGADVAVDRRNSAAVSRMMQRLGRICQQVALLGLPLAIPLQLANLIDLRQMLALMGAAICLFYIGRLIEGYASAP